MSCRKAVAIYISAAYDCAKPCPYQFDSYDFYMFANFIDEKGLLFPFAFIQLLWQLNYFSCMC